LFFLIFQIIMVKEEATEGTKSAAKTPAASLKRPTRKKPKDKPKRPLSAYNFFFKEEREKILKVVLGGDDPKVSAELNSDPDSEEFISPEMMERLRKDGGKVSFEEMGKLIGQRWKNIDPDRLSKYSEMAGEDTERYKKEMQSYNGRQEAKMRSEALKPPSWNSKDPAAKQAAGPAAAGPDSKTTAAAYPGSVGSAFADPSAAAAAAQMGAYGAGYGGGYGGYGMDLSQAYAMQPMAMQAMYGYGGYGMGGMGGMGGMAGMAGMGGGAEGGAPGARGGAPGGAAAAMYGQMMAAGGYGQQMMGYG
jgi:hypothetical protein